MKKLLLSAILIASPLAAQPKVCVLHYPKECRPVVTASQVEFKCEVKKRKLETIFNIFNLFGKAYMPEVLKFAPHDLDHFVWECPE